MCRNGQYASFSGKFLLLTSIPLIRRRQVTFFPKFASQFVWKGVGGSHVAQVRPVWRRANLAFGTASRRECAAKPSGGEGPELAEARIGR
jgi:hypothetical protein